MNKHFTSNFCFTGRYRLLLIFIFGFISCENEEQFSHPLVHTGEVTDISSDGARFHGRVVNEKGIIDHGFVWDNEINPVIHDAYRQSMGLFSSEYFSVYTTSIWEEGEKYFLRAYATDGTNTYYGREVSFISLGRQAPAISKISPTKGTWGDTLTIEGENFSPRSGDNMIHMHNSRAEIIFNTDSLIQIIVPAQLDTIQSVASLSVRGNITYYSEVFSLLPPAILDYSPKTAAYNEKVFIHGKYHQPGKTKIFFGTIEAEIIGQETDTLIVKVPDLLQENDFEVSIDVLGQKSTANDTFYYQHPVITEISPKSVTWKDNITIYGRHFGKEPANTTVEIENVPAIVLSHSKDSIIAKIPTNSLTQEPEVKVTVNTIEAIIEGQITMKDMVIQSFSPHTGTFHDIIEINGKNFNPLKENSNVYLENQQLIIESASPDLLRVKIPSTNQVVQGKLKITCGNMNALSEDVFTMETHNIDNISPLEGTRLDQITIHGQGFSPDYNTNKVFIGEKNAEIVYASKTEIKAEIPNGLEHGMQTIRVKILNHQEEASQQFMLYEPYTRLNNPVFGPRRGAFTFQINNTAYVGGGMKNQSQRDFYEYIPATDSWIPRADVPEYTTSISSFSTPSTGYLMLPEQMHMYNPQTDVWTSTSNQLASVQITHTPFAINDRGYILGSGNNYLVNLWTYIESASQWMIIQPFPIYTAFHGVGFSVGNKGYATLGRDEGHENRIWEYNPETNTWTGKASFNGVMPAHTLKRLSPTTATTDSKAYIFGGRRDFSFDIFYNDAYEFNPATNSIRRVPDIPGPERSFAWAFSVNGIIYLGGGGSRDEDGNYTTYEEFWEFDPQKLPPVNK